MPDLFQLQWIFEGGPVGSYSFFLKLRFSGAMLLLRMSIEDLLLLENRYHRRILLRTSSQGRTTRFLVTAIYLFLNRIQLIPKLLSLIIILIIVILAKSLFFIFDLNDLLLEPLHASVLLRLDHFGKHCWLFWWACGCFFNGYCLTLFRHVVIAFIQLFNMFISNLKSTKLILKI